MQRLHALRKESEGACGDLRVAGCSSREWRKAYLDALWVVRSTLEHECAGGEAPSAPLSVNLCLDVANRDYGIILIILDCPK